MNNADLVHWPFTHQQQRPLKIKHFHTIVIHNIVLLDMSLYGRSLCRATFTAIELDLHFTGRSMGLKTVDINITRYCRFVADSASL